MEEGKKERKKESEGCGGGIDPRCGIGQRHARLSSQAIL